MSALTKSVNAKRLCDLVDSFQGTSITVFGDFILDEYIWGGVDRVSPEAPIVIVDVKSESLRLGGAANVANNLKTLGAQSSICAVIGDDEAGKLGLSLLESQGIDFKGIVTDSNRPTTRKTRVVANSQQIVRVDRELASPIDENISQAVFENVLNSMKKSRALIISDYGKGVINSYLSSFLKENFSKKDSFGKRIPIIVDPKGTDYSRYHGATCVKPNKKEAILLTGKKISSREDAISIAEEIRINGGFEEVMITLGPEGLVLVHEGAEPFELNTIAQEVFDVSGAGDTVSAVYSLSISVGATPMEAAIIANCAAARVIREVGTATLDAEELKAVINFWEENT